MLQAVQVPVQHAQIVPLVQIQTVNVLHVTQDIKNQEQAVLHVQIQNTVLKVIQELKHADNNGHNVQVVMQQNAMLVIQDTIRTEQDAAHVLQDVVHVQVILFVHHVRQVITKTVIHVLHVLLLNIAPAVLRQQHLVQHLNPDVVHVQVQAVLNVTADIT